MPRQQPVTRTTSTQPATRGGVRQQLDDLRQLAIKAMKVLVLGALVLAVVAPTRVAGQCMPITRPLVVVEAAPTLVVSNYQNSQSCWYRFSCSSDSERARLDWGRFDTERGYDYVSTWDGTFSAPQCEIDRISGFSSDGSTLVDSTSQSSYVWVNLDTDGSSYGGGFTVTLRCSSSGAYSPSRSSSATCTDPSGDTTCSAGQWLYQSSCRDCPEGRYGRDDQTACLECPAGTWSDARSDSVFDCSFQQSDDCFPGGTTRAYDDGFKGRGISCSNCCYYGSQSQAQDALEAAGDALGDFVCDQVSEYGCSLYPECCGVVRSLACGLRAR